MSDARVRAAIEEMEAWLADPAWEPEAEALARWDAEFRAAMAQAERAEGWPALAGRAHAAGKLLEARIPVAVEALNRVRAELETQAQGNRALKGYGAGVR
ncbi:MAG: hypothetical protein HXX12_09255 [Geothrix sp.]|uniref:hypothetical protein n=1 Tax=Geothrix sp. TaxID=1962974 RepID=UPI00179A476C|nr:hypothetical protein [Geothrix sp.]NWJ41143.1 hypothetical protein [Geothrix sp.]WIL20868.1 MAG: hypothetical protein QOZ81_000100 [Geothrix sp.]